MRYEYNIIKGDDYPSAQQLNDFSLAGWEVFQIVTGFEGSKNLVKGEVAIYIRRQVTDELDIN